MSDRMEAAIRQWQEFAMKPAPDGSYPGGGDDRDPGDEHDRRTLEVLLAPLMTQRRIQDDEFSRGWNACAAAMRHLLETTR